MATTKKKSDAERLAELEDRVKALKAKLAISGLDAKSPGVAKLIAAVDAVVKENKCKVLDVVKTIIRMKKTPVTLVQTPRTPAKKRTKRTTKKTKPDAATEPTKKATSVSSAPATKKEKTTVRLVTETKAKK